MMKPPLTMLGKTRIPDALSARALAAGSLPKSFCSAAVTSRSISAVEAALVEHGLTRVVTVTAMMTVVQPSRCHREKAYSLSNVVDVLAGIESSSFRLQMASVGPMVSAPLNGPRESSARGTPAPGRVDALLRSEEHTSELQSRFD